MKREFVVRNHSLHAFLQVRWVCLIINEVSCLKGAVIRDGPLTGSKLKGEDNQTQYYLVLRSR